MATVSKSQIKQEAQAVIDGKPLPAVYQKLFTMAYQQGVKDARSNQVVGEEVEKTVSISKENTMSNQVTKQDLVRMQQRLAELTQQVNSQLDGTAHLEKADINGLLTVIKDMDQPLELRNRATDLLLVKCGNDPTKMVALVKGSL